MINHKWSKKHSPVEFKETRMVILFVVAREEKS